LNGGQSSGRRHGNGGRGACACNSSARAQFERDIEARFEHRLGAMRLSSTRHAYPLVASYARRFVAARCALIGDAAVGMHPVTAHGFNLGLRSQETLLKELQRASAQGIDIGAPQVLRRYEAAHRRDSRACIFTQPTRSCASTPTRGRCTG
jgi:2-polyprenyl-6-methoxyphenol hydroxylase-like FAD-dependent oxidoreductase